MYKSRYIFVSLASCLLLLNTSCNDWLTEPSPGLTKLSDFFETESGAVKSVNGAYTPLAWEFNDGTYYSEWIAGDIVSDDALKGGKDVADWTYAFQMDNFQTTAVNPFLLNFYRTQYQGIARCNLAIQEIPKMSKLVISDSLRDRLHGEVLFMRAYYYFRLVRMFGGVPKVDFVLNDATRYKQPRASVEDIYKLIIADLLKAEDKLWKKSTYKQEDMGRATKGAAQAMLLKAYLYTGNSKEAEYWGKILVDQAEQEGEYRLNPEYAANFSLTGENGMESIFEIQYMEEATSDWGDGNGFTRGTLTTISTRSRSTLLGGGYGFNKPTQDLYNEFEAKDPRKDITILNPTDAQMTTPEVEIYLGNRYISRKYALMTDGSSKGIFPLNHDTRSPINIKLIRYADALLMYAEACCNTGNMTQAKWALEKVRKRARKDDATILPEFPGYNGYQNTIEDLLKAVKHERRVELAMEGHRWFDLVRWGVAAEVMNAYRDAETAEVRAKMSVFEKGKHELFPIPQEEVDLGGL